MAKKFFNPHNRGDHREGQNQRDNRDGRDQRDSRNNRDGRENRDFRENRDQRDNRDNRDNRQDQRNRDERQGGRFFDKRRDQRDDRNFQKNNDRDERRKDQFQKKTGFQQGNNRNQDQERKNTERVVPVEKKVLLGKCSICDSNVADEIYSLSIGDEDKKFIHFECMVKRVKQKAQKEFPKVNNYKVYYLGNGIFAAVVEKNYKGMQWEILFKMNIKELLPVQVSEMQKSTS